MDEARGVDAANPADVRDQAGKAAEAPKPTPMRGVTNEDLRTLAQAHEMFGNDRRANELRNLVGDKPKGPVEAFFRRRRTVTVESLLIVGGIAVGGSYLLRWRRNRKAKKAETLGTVTQLPTGTQSPSTVTAPPPFSVPRP